MKKTVEWYQKAAENGNADAMYRLELCYDVGAGIKKDLEKAIKWYQKAAENGHEKAMFMLGLYYYEGEGAQKIFERL